MKRTWILGLLAAGCVASGCSTWEKLDTTERGAVIGGAGGAALGATQGTGEALLGGAAGAIGGGLIGREMDRRDRDDYEEARRRERERLRAERRELDELRRERRDYYY